MESKIKLVVNNEEKKNKYKLPLWYNVAWFLTLPLLLVSMFCFYAGKAIGNDTIGYVSVATWVSFILCVAITETR